jgi:hypothetical protein
MHTNDNNSKPEQRRPDDVNPVAGDNGWSESESMAPPLVQPAGEKDESERPIVDPVTGAPL